MAADVISGVGGGGGRLGADRSVADQMAADDLLCRPCQATDLL